MPYSLLDSALVLDFGREFTLHCVVERRKQQT